jgi:hypothetical protein
MQMRDEYILANGPAGLEEVLAELLARTKNDEAFASEFHYVLYELGNQRSLIRIDTTQFPFKFWHFDLMGRPATKVIRETIARFLLEKCGLKEKYLEEDEME